jgi:S-DNA-T family DNA segregation ATPase FtsK/SpoIIIE
MRFTLDPGGDVDVPDGTTLGRCRPALARLTGAKELTDAVLTVDGTPLPDDHVAGADPWVPGSALSLRRTSPDAVRRAVVAPWHVAVVAGPDAGLVAVPGRDGTVVVARRSGPGRAALGGAAAVGGAAALGGAAAVGPEDVPGRLDLTDPTVSRVPVTVRLHTRRGRRARWRVTGTLPAGPGRSRRPGPRVAGWCGRGRTRSVRAEQRVQLGESTLVVRGPVAPRATEPTPDRTTSRGTDAAPEGSPDLATPSSGPGGHGAAWWAPLLASAGLALALRNPVFLVLGAAGPLGVGLPVALRRLRALRRPVPLGEPRLGSDAALTAVRAAAGALPVEPAWWVLARDGLAVVGPPEARQAVGRALVGGAVADPHVQLCLLTAPRWRPTWVWCRWAALRPLPDGSAGAVRGAAALDAPTSESTRRLVLGEEAHRERTDLHRWWMRRRPGQDAILLLEGPGAALPAWCRWVLHVGEESSVLEGPAGSAQVQPPTGSLRWAEEHARRVAACGQHRDRAAREGSSAGLGPDGRLPRQVALADLLPAEAGDIAGRWALSEAAPHATLSVPLGLGGARSVPHPVEVDLLADGPHALVAGTTGAGKSELLQTWVLGMALRHPPTTLALVLVDYKGGASFGPCADLPHVAGQVTDLDVVEAARALDGLRAELVRRERLLADRGVADVEALRRRGGDVPPRLVVVVDEFRTLTEELPDFVPGLVRLAAQGRSLGIHLVLATQRPAGAVSAQMRANLALRICLRVADTADSSDVVEIPDAAELPADRPGLAVVRRGPGSPELVQTAWAALPPGGWQPPSPDGTVHVRWAPEWAADEVAEVRPAGESPPAVLAEHTRTLVEACRRIAQETELSGPAPVWLPPLPASLATEDLPDDEDALPLGMTDRPAFQDRGVLRWSSGVLVVAGRPGSGRSTALRTTAAAALRRGWAVHVVEGAPAQDVFWSARQGHPRLGTVVGADDPRRLSRLLTLLAQPTSDGPVLLLVDDVGAVEHALELLPRGAGAGLLDPLLREGRHRGLAVAVAGTPADVVHLLPHATDRWVLAVNDPHEDALLGVPRELADGRPVPGRGVRLGAGEQLRCQVALPLGAARTQPAPAAVRAGAPPPLRLRPLPLRAGRPDDDPVPWRPVLGSGGDAATTVLVDVRRGALVVGPAGSGRSTALATLTQGLRAAGHAVVPVARDSGRSHLLGAPPGSVVVVDDLDVLLRADPETDDQLHRWLTAAEAGDPSVPRVVAAARTDRVATAYRGGLAALRTGSRLVVLHPASPGSADVAGVDLSLAVDPVRPRHPGRGVLVEDGRLTPVQVAVPGPPGAG